MEDDLSGGQSCCGDVTGHPACNLVQPMMQFTGDGFESNADVPEISEPF